MAAHHVVLKRAALVAVAAVLGGCTMTGGLLGNAFGEHEVDVREVRRALACGSPTDDPQLTFLDGPTAFTQWERSRNAQLLGDPVLPGGEYAVIEMGRRGFQGYGLAVSKVGGLKRGTLIMRATFIEPAPGYVPQGEAVSPCVLVKLPDIDFDAIELFDQRGQRRATLKLERGA